MNNDYRYIEEGREHRHETWNGTAWSPLIGTSTIAKESVNKGDGLSQWYADLSTLAALEMKMPDEMMSSLLKEYEEIQQIQDKKKKWEAMAKLDKKYPLFGEARKAAIRSRDKSARRGSTRHGIFESYIKHCIEKNEGHPMRAVNADIQVFIDWSLKEVDIFYFTEAHCFSKRLHIGGIADLGLRLKNGKRLVGDHKSSKNAFFDQFVQCSLYDIELAENGILDRDGNKIADWQLADGYVVFPFRSQPFTPEFKWNVDAYREVVEGVVKTYKLKEYDHV